MAKTSIRDGRLDVLGTVKAGIWGAPEEIAAAFETVSP